ncbi:MAG TPA: nuclear transport factor 2 family protein [Bordetella sp.]
MDPSADLARRLARLEAREQIDELMQRYAAAADRKYTALRQKQSADIVRAAAREQAECFTADARWAGGRFGGDLVGRQAIAAFFETSPWLFTAHHYGHPIMRIDASGRSAAVRWRLLELGIREQDGKVALLTGVVDQDCAADDEGWRIARMQFASLHALELAGRPEQLRCLIPEGEPFDL